MLATRARVLVLSSESHFTQPVCAVLEELEAGSVVCMTIEEFSERKNQGPFTAIVTDAYGFGPEWSGTTLSVICEAKIPIIMVTSDSTRVGRQLGELNFKGCVWFCELPREIGRVLSQIVSSQPSAETTTVPA